MENGGTPAALLVRWWEAVVERLGGYTVGVLRLRCSCAVQCGLHSVQNTVVEIKMRV